MLHRSHNEHLLSLMQALFDEAGLTARDVTHVAFGCGPGSFTGVRIAASATQAIAEAAQAQVLGVPSSQILAATAATEIPDAQVLICSVPSRGQAFYLSAYAVKDGAVELLHDNELVEDVPSWLTDMTAAAGFAWVGAVPDWLPQRWQSAVAADLFPSAQALAKLAAAGFARGQGLPAEHALPSYIAGDSPWRKQTTS